VTSTERLQGSSIQEEFLDCLTVEDGTNKLPQTFDK